MKNTIFFILITLTFSSCAQNKKSYNINQYLHPESKEITENNFAEKLKNTIKHYPEEPIYYLRISKRMCFIEVYDNDFGKKYRWQNSNREFNLTYSKDFPNLSQYTFYSESILNHGLIVF